MILDTLGDNVDLSAARASTHGLEVVYVTAGRDNQTQTFTIHKDLLCKSSDFFKSVFNGHFRESATGHLTLSTIDPMTFEVLYHWLYTGSTRYIPQFAEESNVHIDVLWLRVFTMAHEYMVDILQETSFMQFRKVFDDGDRLAPSPACVQELYQSKLPAHLMAMLKSYLILHCAFWISDLSCDCWEWQTVLKNPCFGADIAWELTKRASLKHKGVLCHPQHNQKFSDYKGRVFIKPDVGEEEKEPPEHVESDDKNTTEGGDSDQENKGYW